MKLHLDNNIVEGTPEELVKYQELLKEKEREAELLKSGHMHVGYQEADSYTDSTESSTDEAEEDIKGYTFWYLSGSTFNNDTVLKTTLGGHFEDSKGRIYTYQPIHDFIKPLDREDARKEFEEAKHNGNLLKYYSSIDVFTWEPN
uniref:Uncharacterized protein n=1 Tax=Staphylococcus phage 184DA TaxID=3110532 RepID=A0AAU6MXT9_9CAUD